MKRQMPVAGNGPEGADIRRETRQPAALREPGFGMRQTHQDDSTDGSGASGGRAGRSGFPWARRSIQNQ